MTTEYILMPLVWYLGIIGAVLVALLIVMAMTE